MTLEEIDKQLAATTEELRGLQAEGVAAPGVEKSALPAWWSVTDAMTVSVAVLLFGLMVMWMVTRAISSGRPPLIVLRTYGTIVVVILAVFLIVAGYSNDQITPVIALLGTIVGYLLGRETTPERVEPPPDANKEPSG